VWIDGRSVTSPLGLTGEQMTVAVFNVAIQSSYMEVVKAVTEPLGLETLETLSAWSALASATRQKDGVCIDVGGSSTDVMLILAGSVWATASIPLGGSEFTAQIARGLDIAAPEAERLPMVSSVSRNLFGRPCARLYCLFWNIGWSLWGRCYRWLVVGTRCRGNSAYVAAAVFFPILSPCYVRFPGPGR
jgi:hypothetical protein